MNRDAERRQPHARRVESQPLLGERRVVGCIRGREVRVDSVDGEVRAGRDFRERAIEVVVPESETVHAGVDLQMATERHLASRGGLLEGARGGGRRDRGREVVREHALEIADAQRTKDQDWRAHTRFTQDDAFLDVGTRQHGCAGILERKAYFRGAMAVGVGLDDRDHARGGCCRCSQEVGNGGVVRADGPKVDARNSRTDHLDMVSEATSCQLHLSLYCPLFARFSNRVCSLMKASFAVPVGPLRCFPMMISASPSAS